MRGCHSLSTDLLAGALPRFGRANGPDQRLADVFDVVRDAIFARLTDTGQRLVKMEAGVAVAADVLQTIAPETSGLPFMWKSAEGA